MRRRRRWERPSAHTCGLRPSRDRRTRRRCLRAVRGRTGARRRPPGRRRSASVATAPIPAVVSGNDPWSSRTRASRSSASASRGGDAGDRSGTCRRPTGRAEGGVVASASARSDLSEALPSRFSWFAADSISRARISAAASATRAQLSSATVLSSSAGAPTKRASRYRGPSLAFVTRPRALNVRVPWLRPTSSSTRAVTWAPSAHSGGALQSSSSTGRLVFACACADVAVEESTAMAMGKRRWPCLALRRRIFSPYYPARRVTMGSTEFIARSVQSSSAPAQSRVTGVKSLPL
ncbi:MAG: hypothetical protein K0S65_3627 [Labilithrix sp.]|nr:hypothetical protein [Labilithrix sp.]